MSGGRPHHPPPTTHPRQHTTQIMILTFRDLDVWQNAMKLAESVYLITGKFPNEEKFGLISQMRRCAVSVPSNIAEGFMRKNTKEYIQFLHIALGSLGELDTQLELSKRLKFCSDTDTSDLPLELTRKQLYGLLKALKNKV